jgi:hypothetical protein
MMRKPVRVAAFAFWMGLLVPKAAQACTCFSSPEPKTSVQITREIAAEVRRSAAVFSGQVVARTPLTVTFLVENVWKGSVSRRFEMASGAVGNADGSITTSCEFPFKVGETYVVFAYGSSRQSMHASQCTFTNALAFAPDTPAYLNRVSKPRRPQR